MNSFWLLVLLLALGGHQATASAQHGTLAMDTGKAVQLRMDVRRYDADGHLLSPLKYALIVQQQDEAQYQLWRVLAPARWRGQKLLAHWQAEHAGAIFWRLSAEGGCLRDAGSFADWPGARQIWLLMRPWQTWAVRQQSGKDDEVNGHDCRWQRVRSPDGRWQVERCMDQQQPVSWRTRLLNHRGNVLQTIDISKLIRRNNGKLAARDFTISDADGSRTTVHVYSGDEDYQPAAGMFLPPEGCAAQPVLP